MCRKHYVAPENKILAEQAEVMDRMKKMKWERNVKEMKRIRLWDGKYFEHLSFSPPPPSS